MSSTDHFRLCSNAISPDGDQSISSIIDFQPNLKFGLHITLLLTVSADGSFLAPLLILPLKEFPQDLLSASNQFCWAEIQQRKMKANLLDSHALLILDGHSSRENSELMESLQEKKN